MVRQKHNLRVTVLFLWTFRYSTLPWMYLVSRFFSSSDVAFISYISLNFVFGLCTMLVTLLPRLLAIISKVQVSIKSLVYLSHNWDVYTHIHAYIYIFFFWGYSYIVCLHIYIDKNFPEDKHMVFKYSFFFCPRTYCIDCYHLEF